MILKKLLSFHQDTLNQYRQEETLVPWKKKVMQIHEESGFLFYFEELKESEERTLEIFGETASGQIREDSKLFLYDGKGELLGDGTLLSSPEDKEEHRRGLQIRKNCFLLRPDHYLGHEVSGMSQAEYKRALTRFELDLSLISDRFF